jgi:hypothetical protein
LAWRSRPSRIPAKSNRFSRNDETKGGSLGAMPIASSNQPAE